MDYLRFPDYAPIYPLSKKVSPSIRRAKLPDSSGIEQRRSFGLNQIAPEFEVKWRVLHEDAQVIDDFLSECAEYNAWFWWTHPDGTKARYRCDEWSKSISEFSVTDISAKFIRHYPWDVLPKAITDNSQLAFNFTSIGLWIGIYITVESSQQFISFASIGVGRKYERAALVKQITIEPSEANFSKSFLVDYYADMAAQIYAGDRDFQVDWWGD